MSLRLSVRLSDRRSFNRRSPTTDGLFGTWKRSLPGRMAEAWPVSRHVHVNAVTSRTSARRDVIAWLTAGLPEALISRWPSTRLLERESIGLWRDDGGTNVAGRPSRSTVDFLRLGIFQYMHWPVCSHSCYGMRIGNRTQASEWYSFQWPNPDHKVTPFFDAEYLRNSTR